MARPRYAGALAALIALVGAGCTEHDIDPQLTIEVSEVIPTAVVVEWDLQLEQAVGAFVEFGGGLTYDRRATVEVVDGRARAVLIGNKQRSTVGLRVVEIAEGVPHVGARHTVRTGALDVDMPGLELELGDPDEASDGYTITAVLNGQSTAMIVDGDGDVVWAHQPAGDHELVNILRVIRSQTSDRVVYMAGVGDDDGSATPVLERMAISVGLDGAGERSTPLPGAHHDLVERADGLLVTLIEDVRLVGDREIVGDALVEVDADGNQRVLWSAWDHFEFDPEDTYSEYLGWTHANAVDYDLASDAYLVSLHNLDCIVAIDATTGAQRYVLGGTHSDVAEADGNTTLYQRQHQFELLDDGGILVFDNGLADGLDSRVVQYALDRTSGLATRTWEYHLDPPQLNVAYGDVHRLPEDHTLVTWSALGQIDEVTPDGEVVWRLRSDLGAGFGYTLWRDNLYDTVFEF